MHIWHFNIDLLPALHILDNFYALLVTLRALSDEFVKFRLDLLHQIVIFLFKLLNEMVASESVSTVAKDYA
jgi:hypothetical protein